MSISDNYAPLKELGNGVTTEFSDDWAMLSSSFARVFLEDVATGVQTLLDEGAASDEYQIEFDDDGFVVTLGTAPSADNFVVVAREVSQDQTTPYKTSKGFQGSVTEGSFDKITAITQDLQDQVSRSPKSPVGSDPISFPAYEADKNIGWSPTENGVVINSEKTITEIDGAVEAVAALTAQSGVKVSSNDTTVGFLNGKLVAGTSISFTENNDGSSETLTVNVPAASETVVGAVEAATTAEMSAGTANKFPDAAKVKAYADSVAPTSPISESYVSSAQTIGNGNLLTLPHGLTSAPTLFTFQIVCTTADLNYSIGDVVVISAGRNDSARGLGVYVDATNVYVRFGSSGLSIINKTTGGDAAITNSSWELVVRAWV